MRNASAPTANLNPRAENRPVSISQNGTTIATFTYDGDGNRVKKIEGGQTILYINKYYEVNLTTGNATSYYYLGNRLIAMSENATMKYVHQDRLTGTSLMTDSSGASLGIIKYAPYGDCLESQGVLATDRLFTGQRLDDTGFYYYGARYYDPPGEPVVAGRLPRVLFRFRSLVRRASTPIGFYDSGAIII